VLQALSPLTLVLEDLHWADELTVDLLRYLFAELPDGLSLVLTMRAEDADLSVRALASRLTPPARRAHVSLAPLDRAQTGELAARLLATDRVTDTGTPTSIWGDAWRRLRRNPVFLVAVVLIALVLLVVVWPSLFAGQDPRLCLGEYGMDTPRSGHPFGFDKQGCDIYARTIYGARASVSVGVGAALLFARKHSELGGAQANQDGKAATTRMIRIITEEIQNIGRRRMASQASAQVLRALPLSSSLSITSTGVSSSGAM